MNFPGGMYIFPMSNINAGLPWWLSSLKKKNPPAMQETHVDPWVVKIPWIRK